MPNVERYDKPDIEELMHYGVLGMKWGRTRAKASSASVRTARQQVNKEKRKIDRQDDKVNKLRRQGKSYKREEAQLKKMNSDFLKNPDRVTAARMTRGEKISLTALSTLALGPVGLGIAVSSIAGTSARSRTIERRQETGAYNKK